MDTSIPKTEISAQPDKALKRLIVRALKRRKGRATLADVVVDTGIPNLEVERLLRTMIGEYSCHLEVTDDGELYYEFDPRMIPLRSREWVSARTKAIGRKLWTGFRTFMKALIMIVMVVYFILFVVLVIAAMVAASRGRSSSSRGWGGRSSSSGGGNFFFWYWVFGRPSYRRRRHTWHNPTYGRYDSPRWSSARSDPRPFYLKVFSFVLGPEPGDVEPLVDEPALLAYARKQGGVLTRAQVASRTGWSLKQTERLLTKMVAKFEGDIRVTDDAVIVFVFPELLTSAGSKGIAPALPFWKRKESPMPITGNSASTNAIVMFLNGFNLVVAAVVPQLILPPLEIAPTVEALIGLSYFPMAFSGLVFLIPLIRFVVRIGPANRGRKARNTRRSLYKQVFKVASSSATKRLSTGGVVEQVIADHAFGKTEPPSEQSIQALAGDIFADLEGEVAIEDVQSPDEHTFKVLHDEIEAAREAKAPEKAEVTSKAKTVFSTRETR